METVQNKVSKEQSTLPVYFNLEGVTSVREVVSWYKQNEKVLDRGMLEEGAILLQNTNIDTVDGFHDFTESVFPKFRDYIDGNYPRRQLKDHVYISTEYDPIFDITLHNELSYSENWPSKLVFGCCLPPQEGGETPLVDSRQICKHISRDLLEELEAKDVKYIRNLHGGSGLGPSWQDTFETESRAKLESTCNELKIKFEWRSDGGVKLISKRPATRFHPITKEKVWFNQVDQYHPSHFPKEVYETLMLVADGNESELPLNVSFGDDTPITVDIIKEITATVNELMVVRKWNKSDIVIVDNMLIGHGRKSYKGNRKIIVSMAV